MFRLLCCLCISRRLFLISLHNSTSVHVFSLCLRNGTGIYTRLEKSGHYLFLLLALFLLVLLRLQFLQCTPSFHLPAHCHINVHQLTECSMADEHLQACQENAGAQNCWSGENGEVEEDEDEVDGCSGMKSREKHFISITYENLQSLL